MEVIYLNWEDRSFTWSNGLYAIAKVINNEYHLARIGDNGMLCKYEDGRLNITITHINCPAIEKTSLVCNEKI